jgi:hypothetical protein
MVPIAIAVFRPTRAYSPVHNVNDPASLIGQ